MANQSAFFTGLETPEELQAKIGQIQNAQDFARSNTLVGPIGGLGAAIGNSAFSAIKGIGRGVNALLGGQGPVPSEFLQAKQRADVIKNFDPTNIKSTAETIKGLLGVGDLQSASQVASLFKVTMSSQGKSGLKWSDLPSNVRVQAIKAGFKDPNEIPKDQLASFISQADQRDIDKAAKVQAAKNKANANTELSKLSSGTVDILGELFGQQPVSKYSKDQIRAANKVKFQRQLLINSNPKLSTRVSNVDLARGQSLVNQAGVKGLRDEDELALQIKAADMYNENFRKFHGDAVRAKESTIKELRQVNPKDRGFFGNLLDTLTGFID